MKVSKNPVSSVARIAKGGGRNNVTTPRPQAIKLKAVTDAERQRLRISSYRYILP